MDLSFLGELYDDENLTNWIHRNIGDSETTFDNQKDTKIVQPLWMYSADDKVSARLWCNFFNNLLFCANCEQYIHIFGGNCC